ncbi:ChbG/HpnK family deacetylase [Roseibium sp. MMSF_3544]|uniref:ChbG/HpnK family deacetylase n=1 Tax=unclassified Roseibium TaxID=2629323 RepID=UPI00273E3CB6|nr:ChbG/HpnK family deacetylase [Roseibium sp. MMSF_3544]
MSREIRLLVRADDAGSSWSSNIGCLRACTKGIARSVEVMMPCAWTSHAAQILNGQPEVDIGIHLTLTSEWDAVKWRPITQARSLVDERGDFLPLLTPRDGDNRRSLSEVDWLLDEIASEFRAQIVLGIEMFQNVSHVSSHMLKHFKDFDARLGDVISDLCLEYGLDDDAFGHGLPRIEGYPKFPRDTGQRVKAFVHQLEELDQGTHIFIDHPAITSPELSVTGHSGYEDAAEDRVTCLETLTSPALRERVDQLGIELISYRDL